MTDPKFRLAEAPVLVLNNPDCGTCDVTVEADSEGYTCPNCGTYWSYSDNPGDGDEGQLYAEWSGEDVDDLPLVNDEDAWKYADDYAALVRANAEPEPVNLQCADVGEPSGLADVLKARDAARATKAPTDPAPLFVSRYDAALIAGTPAESGIVVSAPISPRPSAFLSPRFIIPGQM